MTRLTRRELIATGAAAGVLAASGLPARAMPRRGGTLRAVLPGASVADSWDARRHQGLFMAAAGMGAVFECLTEITADGSLRGELATRWTGSRDARVWRLYLREDVRFHNGKAFGAEDVIASLDLHRDPAGRSPAWPIVADITAMRARGSHAVEITLARGNADFPYLLSDYHLLIYPAGQIERAMRDGIGTGPYRVVLFEPGQRLRAARIDDHWKDGQAAWFDGIDLVAEPAGHARVDALRAARTDVAAGLPAAAIAGLSKDSALSLHVTRGNQFTALELFTQGAPFDAVALRRALAHAIDRQGLVDTVLAGHGTVGADTPVSPLAPYHAALPVPEFDPDRARDILRRADLSRLRVALPVSDVLHPSAVEMAWHMRDSARAAGIDLAVREQRAAVHGPTPDIPLVQTAWWGRPTEDWMLSSAFVPGADWAKTGWDGGASFQAHLAEARASFDPALRAEIYRDLQTRIAADAPMIVPAFADHLQATRKTVATPAQIGAMWPMDNARFAQRWWMA